MNPAAKISIGSLLFPNIDQADFTGPFEVFAHFAQIHTLVKQKGALRDARGLLLTAEQSLADCPPLDVLHIPGGFGQQALMEDEQILAFLRDQSKKSVTSSPSAPAL